MKRWLVFLSCWPLLAQTITPDPTKAILVFTDVPAGAKLFIDGNDVTAQAAISGTRWQVATTSLARRFRCAFQFTEASTPQVAERDIEAHAGEVLQLSVRTFSKRAATSLVGPQPIPGRPDGAIIRVLVPRTTKLTINDAPTIQEGERREFWAKLAPGETATYRIYIDFRDITGRQVIRERAVTVRAGDVIELTLTDFAEAIGR